MSEELVMHESENTKAEGWGVICFMYGDVPQYYLSLTLDNRLLLVKNSDELEQKRGILLCVCVHTADF